MRILIHHLYLTKIQVLFVLVTLFLMSCKNNKLEYKKEPYPQYNLLNIQRNYINDSNFKSDCLTYEIFDEPCVEDLDIADFLLRVRINRINYGTEIFVFQKYGIDGIYITRKYANNSCDNLFSFIGHRTVKYEVKKIYLPESNLYNEAIVSLLSKNVKRDRITNAGDEINPNITQVVLIDYLKNNSVESIEFYSEFNSEEMKFIEKLWTKFNQWPLDEELNENEERK